MRACIYTRVSADSRQGRSVREQETDCRQVAEREGWDVVRVFTDNDRGASRHSKGTRKAYNDLRQFLAAGKADVLVTWESSRAQRDLAAYVELRELCAEHGVLWSYSGRTHDLSEHDDRFTTGLDALLAEREAGETRKRVLRAVRANANEGKPHGRIPFGYKREYDKTTGELVRQVIYEPEAKLIREAARRLLGGETCNSIAADFNRRGIPASRKGAWDLTRVRRLITNPAYIAQRVHQGKVIGAATWPAILDVATFNRCAAIFSDPRRKTTNEHAVKYLLSGIAICDVCGERVKVQPQRNYYKSYMCRSFCVTRKLEWVDDAIERLLLARLAQPDALAAFVTDDIDNNALLDEIAAKRAHLETFYDAASNGELSAAGLARIEAKVLPEIEALEGRLQRMDVPAVVYELAKQPAKVWPKLTLEQKRAAITCLMEVRIKPGRTGVKRFDPTTLKVTWRGSNEEALAVPA